MVLQHRRQPRGRDCPHVARGRMCRKGPDAACLPISEVTEKGVVTMVDAVKGRMAEVYSSLKPGVTTSARDMTGKVTQTIETTIAKIGRQKTVQSVPDM